MQPKSVIIWAIVTAAVLAGGLFYIIQSKNPPPEANPSPSATPMQQEIIIATTQPTPLLEAPGAPTPTAAMIEPTAKTGLSPFILAVAGFSSLLGLVGMFSVGRRQGRQLL